MGKSSNRADGKRAKGKNKKKETFKKYGKNTSRGMRIKQALLDYLGLQGLWVSF